MDMMKPEYDVIIIGAGPAGLTAGIYALRSGLKTLILESKYPGGRILEAHLVENYPGFPEGVTGYDLVVKMTSQLDKFGDNINVNEEAISLRLTDPVKTVHTRQNKYSASTIIIAFGVRRKRLFISGEKEYLGKGVSYCATCDGPLFKGKRVAVVGAGNEAFEEAIFLSDLAQEVHLIPNGVEITAAKTLVRKFSEKANTSILKNQQVHGIEGEASVHSLQTKDLVTDRIKNVPVDGVFIAVGVVPMTAIIEKAGIEITRQGWIKVDRVQRTNLNGVFAAGDCTGRGFQVATAVGEGAMAALAAARYIKTK